MAAQLPGCLIIPSQACTVLGGHARLDLAGFLARPGSQPQAPEQPGSRCARLGPRRDLFLAENILPAQATPVVPGALSPATLRGAEAPNPGSRSGEPGKEPTVTTTTYRPPPAHR